MNIGNNILILVAAWLVVTGTGFYVTFAWQPQNLDRVKKAEQLAGLRYAEVSELLVEAAETQQNADEALRKWHSRYKIIPDSLESPGVVRYLNSLTSAGFKNFDVALTGIHRQPDYNYYSFAVTGRGFYSSLYRFVWEIENNRMFYRVRDIEIDHLDVDDNDPETGNARMQVMVAFRFTLDALFGGREGLSAADASIDGMGEGKGLPMAKASELPPVPASVLPDAQPRTNPFFPRILDKLPPNTYNLVDLEQASLVAIVGNKAVFQDNSGMRKLGVGDEVYLGRVQSVDPKRDLVVVRLNKGGIIDEVELALYNGEHFRQASGPVQLAPITD